MTKPKINVITKEMKVKARIKSSNDITNAHIHFTLGNCYLESAYGILKSMNLSVHNLKHWGKTCINAFDHFNKEFENTFLKDMTRDEWASYTKEFDKNLQLQKDWSDKKIIVVRPMPQDVVDDAVKTFGSQEGISEDMAEGFKLGIEWTIRMYQEMGGHTTKDTERKEEQTTN